MRHTIPAILLSLFIPHAATAALTPPRKIVLIVLENNEYSQIIGSAQAPYLNHLAHRYALATNYYSQRHPSLPNYLDIVSGTGHGIKDDDENHVVTGEFIGRQIKEAGYSVTAYAESLPPSERKQRPCTFSSSGLYAKRHEPFAFFDWVQGKNGETQHCSLIRPLDAFNPAKLKAFSLISPNTCHDMHDCGISAGDQWLHQQVPAILKNMKNKDLVIITWDEGQTNLRGGGHVATIFAGPGARRRFKDRTTYTHDSLLRTIQDIFQVPCLANSCLVTPMTRMLR
jgi:phosphatidylinositol-3-phosphatase